MEQIQKQKENANQGVTLIALVITIIVLLILAGVTILTLTGENGILGKGKKAEEETNKQTATEILNLKITNAQITNYVEKQQMPTLKELSESFRVDEEIAYVTETSQKVASVYYEVGDNPNTIFTRLKEYPYEFEIDTSLRLASIDGIKLADNDNNNISSIIETLKTQGETIQELDRRIKALESETVTGKRENLTKEDFEIVEIPTSTVAESKNFATINLIKPVTDYKYLEFFVDIDNGSYVCQKTIFVAVDSLKILQNGIMDDDSKTCVVFKLDTSDAGYGAAVDGVLRSDKTIEITYSKATNEGIKNFRIRNIYGIK